MTERTYPTTLEGGNNDGAIFLGIEEGDPVYWNYQIDQLVKPRGEVNAPPYLESTFSLANSNEWVGEYIAASTKEGLWSDSSQIGAFLSAVGKHEDTPGMLGERQAVVYVLTEMVGISVKHVSRALKIGESTVYNTRSEARKKIEAYQEVLNQLN